MATLPGVYTYPGTPPPCTHRAVPGRVHWAVPGRVHQGRVHQGRVAQAVQGGPDTGGPDTGGPDTGGPGASKRVQRRQSGLRSVKAGQGSLNRARTGPGKPESGQNRARNRAGTVTKDP